jgi:hypothetical protein
MTQKQSLKLYEVEWFVRRKQVGVNQSRWDKGSRFFKEQKAALQLAQEKRTQAERESDNGELGAIDMQYATVREFQLAKQPNLLDLALACLNQDSYSGRALREWHWHSGPAKVVHDDEEKN